VTTIKFYWQLEPTIGPQNKSHESSNAWRNNGDSDMPRISWQNYTWPKSNELAAEKP
jgi:hypothetical protein